MATHWSAFLFVPVIVVVVTPETVVDAFSAAAFFFLRKLWVSASVAASEKSSLESESDEITTLSTSSTLHQSSSIDGLLKDAQTCDGLIGAKWKSNLSPVPSRR